MWNTSSDCSRAAPCARHSSRYWKNFARELLAEQHQLQRPAFPVGPDLELRRQHHLVDGRAIRELRRIHVLRRDIQLFAPRSKSDRNS
jgi:hypothetical protein